MSCRSVKTTAIIIHWSAAPLLLNVAILALLLLLPVMNGAKVDDEQRRQRQRPKVTRVEMSTEEGFRIYQHWSTQAVTALMSAFLQAKMNDNELPPVLPDRFSSCFLKSETVPTMATCISRLLMNQQEQQQQRQHPQMVIRTGLLEGERKRFERYKKPVKYNRVDTWIGQFQVVGGGKALENRRRGPLWNRARNAKKNKILNYRVIKGHKPALLASPRLSKYTGKWPPKKSAKTGHILAKRAAAPRTALNTAANVLNEEENALYNIGKAKRPDYALLEPKRSYGLSPVGGLARLLMANVLSRSNRTETPRPWQETVKQIKELKKFKGNFLGPPIQRHSPTAEKVHQEPMRREQPGFREFLFRNEPPSKMPRGGEKPLDEQISDLVKDGIKIGMQLAKQQQNNGTVAVKATKAGKKDVVENAEEDAEGLMDVLSPRFLSISERNVDEQSNVFSPSLFSLHDRGKGLEKELSLPNLMRGSQLTGRDQQEWLDLIMETSGVNEQMDSLSEYLPSSLLPQQQTGHAANKWGEPEEEENAVEARYKREFKGLYLAKEDVRVFGSGKDGTKKCHFKVRDLCGDIEERKADTWAALNRKFTEEQRKEMNRTGYALLTRHQLEFVYGAGSPFNDSEALTRLRPLLANNSTNIQKIIEADIHRMAQMRSFDIRQNDVVLRPSLFNPAILNPRRTSQPIILSPLVFSPTILSPTLMGPAILTPRLFSPTILSPRVMTPLIFSPFLFSSIIVNPIVMQPFILSPGLLNGVILSPFVMNPMIMSSQIMHPFILSPLVMTPGLANPSAMSPLVLSPFVMNPQVLSPKAISGLFLSPYALSPVLYSPVYAYLVVLSPSWLS